MALSCHILVPFLYLSASFYALFPTARHVPYPCHFSEPPRNSHVLWCHLLKIRLLSVVSLFPLMPSLPARFVSLHALFLCRICLPSCLLSLFFYPYPLFLILFLPVRSWCVTNSEKKRKKKKSTHANTRVMWTKTTDLKWLDCSSPYCCGHWSQRPVHFT